MEDDREPVTVESTEVTDAEVADAGDEESGSLSRLYFFGGALSTLVSVLVIPFVGVISVFCGYKLHQQAPRSIWGGVFVGAGGVGLSIGLLALVLL